MDRRERLGGVLVMIIAFTFREVRVFTVNQAEH